MKNRGILRYNYDENRYGIMDSSDEWYISGLHCGMCFEVLYNGHWVPTRIEMAEDWFLMGLPVDMEMRGLPVRM